MSTRVVYNNLVAMSYKPIFHVQLHRPFCAIAKAYLPSESRDTQIKGTNKQQTI